MLCPQCSGDLEPIDLRAVSGALVNAKRCIQCAGFWFPRDTNDQFQKESVDNFDRPMKNYSLKNLNLVCPNDKTLLSQIDSGSALDGIKSWHCNDCDGTFFPRGQLALYADWQERTYSREKIGMVGRAQAAGAVALLFTLFVVIGGSLTKVQYSAADGQVLPTSGPNVMTLILLALTYLAGTVLAILSRKVALLLIGWAVILLCLFGFALIIFGP